MKSRFLFALFALLMPNAVIAQSSCDATILATELELFVTILDASSAPVDTLTLINDWVDNAIVACTSSDSSTAESSPTDSDVQPILSYSSDEFGRQAVIGPVEIPDGLYRITTITDGFLVGQIDVISGECITAGFDLFNFARGHASDGANSLFGSVGCNGVIEIGNAISWTVEFYKMDLDNVEPVKSTYSSDDLGQIAVSDLLVFEDGEYRVYVETDGFFSAKLEPVIGNCNLGIISLFSVRDGEASDGAETRIVTEDCVGIVTTSEVDQPWTMTFEKIG